MCRKMILAATLVSLFLSAQACSSQFRRTCSGLAKTVCQ